MAGGRRGSYLYKRPGSQNWWIRFQYSGRLAEKLGKVVQISLETPDRAQAELEAIPYIYAHKGMLLLAKGADDGTLRVEKRAQQYEPGREHRTESGERVIATPDQLIFMDEAGNILRMEPNGPAYELSVPSSAQDQRELSALRPRKKNDPDVAILETWLEHENIRPAIEREARTVFDTFKKLTNGKSFANATREDGRSLAKHFFDSGNKSATVQKKIGHLRAAVNLAIDENKLKFNPFSGVVAAKDDAQDRPPLDDDDMKIMRDNLENLDPEERLLWMLCATTGMRRGEAWDIDCEFIEKGVRCIRIGTKTPQSDRRIPLPAAVIPYLPAKIEGPLFAGSPKNVGRELIRAMRRFGIADQRKVLHSLRHRAQDRLRAEGYPEDIRWAILGHEDKTVADGYGKGFPMLKLKPWIEKIGF
ncbi:site-specific integrase [Microvirga thermotolerans]|nr:tyrosine-type recombinase/integrase [Microvirga thermotolerans]